MNKQLENLREMNKIRSKKSYIDKKCNMCGGDGIDKRTHPLTQCEKCNGSGLLRLEEIK